MGATDDVACPAADCSFEGTLSRVIHHVTERDDASHAWEALGYRNSWEFRNAHESSSDARTAGDGVGADSGADTDSGAESDAGAASGAPPGSAGSATSLESVPGIGDTRASALRDAGYESAEAVAEASVTALSRTPKVSESTARCIRVTAREECGYSETFVARLAASLDADRTAVADAYAPLAGVNVTPEEATRTLELLFDSDAERSIVRLSEYSVRFRHFLLREGFERIDDVARASIDELTDASYVGETLAERIRASARELLEARSGRPADADPSADAADPPVGAEGENEKEHDAEGENEEEHGAEGGVSAAFEEEPAGVTVPAELRDRDQWLLWKRTEDGRKVPRAPWTTGDPLTYASAMEPSNWVSFAEAAEWRSKLPHDLHLAYALTRDDDIVFVDLDDVVVDGEPTPEARRLIERADSYAAESVSGTGVHVFVRGSLSEGVKSLTGQIDEAGEQSVEVYERNRFVAVTGDHLEGTPTDVTDGESLLADLEDEFASVSSETPDRATVEPQRSREELRELETTSDIQDVFDAVHQTRPSDIRMRSTKTRERGDGTYSYDPSWTHSESGTRLGVLDDVWIYREGMIALNALQVVALEEGIIADERDYPEGEDFWDAVEALRERGADIPRFEPEGEPIDRAAGGDADEAIDEGEVAERINYGDPVRTYVHPYDRDYQEDLALELAPILVEAAESLRLSPAVAYRAAELYAKGHAAGIVPGAAHESTLGAALRIASIEADAPRPLADVADALGENPKSVRGKFHRLMRETDLSETLDAAELAVGPADYVPYLARKLGVADDDPLRETVRELLYGVDSDGGTNPMSEVAAAFYAAARSSSERSMTQREVADAAELSTVTIRNNYEKYIRET